jgi:hypothetical protein
MTAPLLLGTHFYPGSAEELRRQGHAMDALSTLDDVQVVDLQWEDQPPKRAWMRTVPTLRHTSTGITGCDGRVKPLLPDMFDALAASAIACGSRYFVFFNADIIVTPAAVALIRQGGRDVYAFARMNCDANGRDLGMYIKGLDAFAFDVAWWHRHRGRFRPFVVGERSWDNVYGAIVMCHANAVLLNREPVMRHEVHPIAWGSGPFDAYNRLLTALDFPYFQLWETYYHRLADARALGASEAEEQAIAREIFVWRPTFADTLRQTARRVNAHVRYRRDRRSWRHAAGVAAD